MLRSTSVFLALSLAAGLVPGLALAQQNEAERASPGKRGGRQSSGQWGPHPLHGGNQLGRYYRDHPRGFVHRPRYDAQGAGRC
jgi:hypothetical protein